MGRPRCGAWWSRGSPDLRRGAGAFRPNPLRPSSGARRSRPFASSCRSLGKRFGIDTNSSAVCAAFGSTNRDRHATKRTVCGHQQPAQKIDRALTRACFVGHVFVRPLSSRSAVRIKFVGRCYSSGSVATNDSVRSSPRSTVYCLIALPKRFRCSAFPR